MTLNDKDYNRLINAIKQLRDAVIMNENVRTLAAGLKDAVIIPARQTPENLVTMNSTVLLKRLDNKQELVLTIVYHADADLKEKKISVFAPMGAAVIGRKENEMIECAVPNGYTAYRVQKIIYQPEKAGDHAL